MPTISTFFGIVITMYWDDHNPAHFHSRYGEYEAVVEIKSGIVSGKFPPRVLGLVQEWRILNEQALMGLGVMPKTRSTKTNQTIGII